MRSSYRQNGYEKVLRNLVYAFTPQKCVEIGVLDGYSTLAIAKGIKHTKKVCGHVSHLDAYDLWDDYEYNHGSMEEVQKMLRDEKVDEFVTLHKKDAYQVHKRYDDVSVCFVHIDISNTGDVLKKMIDLWYPKLTFGGMIVFEGGSEERDVVDWMITYDKAKIKPEVESNAIINTKFLYGTYYAFPSLTVLIKKL